MSGARSLLGRHAALIIVGLFLAYSLALLWSVFSSQRLLLEATDRRLLADSERRAAVIADFFDERAQDAAQIAESREIQDYFVNQALGMSSRYGLNLSLDAIDRRLDDYLQGKTLRSLPVFSSLRLMDEAGRRVAGAGIAPPLRPGLPGGDVVRLHIDYDACCYEVFAPVSYRGERRGFILAMGRFDTLGAMLIGDRADGEVPLPRDGDRSRRPAGGVLRARADADAGDRRHPRRRTRRCGDAGGEAGKRARARAGACDAGRALADSGDRAVDADPDRRGRCARAGRFTRLPGGARGVPGSR